MKHQAELVDADKANFKELKKKYKAKKLTKCGMYAPYTFRVCLDISL